MCVLLLGTTTTTGGGHRVASSKAHPHILWEPESSYNLTWYCGRDLRTDDRRRDHLLGRGCRRGHGANRENGRRGSRGLDRFSRGVARRARAIHLRRELRVHVVEAGFWCVARTQLDTGDACRAGVWP